MTVLWVIGGIVGGIVALALLMPCAACKKRRERLENAYAEWRKRQASE
jgi:hypothetical protein